MGIALSRNRTDFSEKERLMLDLLRSHLVQAYRSIHTINLTHKNIEESTKEFMIVNRFGQVQVFSDQVWQMLDMYFGFLRSPGTLPTDMNDWCTRERVRLSQQSDIPSPPTPLEVYKGDNRLTVHLIWGGKEAVQDVLLFEEEPIKHITAIPDNLELTVRETEICSLISKGKTNIEISQALSLSSRTVKKHLEHIYTKLGVHTRGAAVARFLQL